MSLSSVGSIVANCPLALVTISEHLVANRTTRRHGVVLTSSRHLVLVIASLALAGCQSGSLSIPHGLHNSTKAFTPRRTCAGPIGRTPRKWSGRGKLHWCGSRNPTASF